MRSTDRLCEAGALFIVLLLAAYLRLANLYDNPAWYTDEGTHLDIARHLIAGRVQYLTITQSTLLFSRLPLFEVLLATAMRLTDDGVGALRSLTGLLGVSAVAALYGVMRRYDRWLAFIAATLLAIYPPAILYSRFGFSYNLLAPLLLIALHGAYVYTRDRSKRWLAIAALTIGLGTISDLWMFTVIVPLMIVVLTRNWCDGVWSLLLALLPFTLYIIAMLLTAPQALIFDLSFVLSRLNQLPLTAQMQTLISNITTLLSQDGWLAVSIVGLLILPRLRAITLLFCLLPIVLLGRTVALYSLSFYYMIPLLPLVPLGMASLIRYGVPRVIEAIGDTRARTVAYLLVGALVVTPFALSLTQTIDQVRGHFNTAIDPFLITAGDAAKVADYVNRHVQADDVVIASPGLAWLITANAADFQMSIAYTGRATPHLPADAPRDRFAFDPTYRHARFVIVDNLWRNWAVPDVNGVAEMLEQVETWPLMFKSGEVAIYENPR